jgi:UPF0755 protein
MKHAKKIKSMSLLIVLLVIVLVSALEFVKQHIKKPINIDSEQILRVENGHYAHYVINRLYGRGIIEHPIAFKIMLKLKPELAKIKTGTYQLAPTMSGIEVFEMLSKGDEKQYSISLVEGLRWSDWLAQLNGNEMLLASKKSHDDWLTSLQPLPQGFSMEGWLMPDTYYFPQYTSVDNIVNRAYQSMHKYLLEAWSRRQVDLPYENSYEALIMASIIEKETGLAEERPRIAGVFVNRLRKKMRLQTDPTVIYGIGESFDGDIRRKDLRTPTPYNTYVIKGLPPTPIAMPSKLAIDAALNPMETEDLYFVSRGDGSHYFSRTLDEHNQAVRKYQLKK